MLSASEVESFVADGYLAIRGAVPAGTVRSCRDVIWSELAKQGVAEHDPATWTQPVVRIPCPEGGPFADAGTQPVLWDAFDQLIGPGRWWRRRGVGGTIPVRFPSEGDPAGRRCWPPARRETCSCAIPSSCTPRHGRIAAGSPS